MNKKIFIRVFALMAMALCFVVVANAASIDRMTGVAPKLRSYLKTLETKSFNIPLTSFFIDGTGIIGNDGTTAPGIGETDDVPAIVYASSAESAKIQHTFELPVNYADGLAFRVMMSSSATDASQAIDWQVWVNDDAVAFDAAAIDQTAVAPASADYDTINEVIVLTLDATGEAALSAGSVVTVDIWNGGTSDNTTEIKSVQGRYNIHP